MGKRIQVYTTYQASCIVNGAASGAPICQLAPSQNASPTIDVTMGLVLVRLKMLLPAEAQAEVGLTTALTLGTADGNDALWGVAFRASQGNGGISSGGDGTQGGNEGRIYTKWSVNPTPTLSGGNPFYAEQGVIAPEVGATLEWTWPDDNAFTTGPNGYLSRGPNATLGKGLLLMNMGAGVSPKMAVTMRWLVMSATEAN